MGIYRHSGFSLMELLVAGFAGTIILLALASTLEVVWNHFVHAQHYNRVDTMLSVSDKFIRSQIANGAGNYYWVPAGSSNKSYFYSHTGSNAIITSGIQVDAAGSWVAVEDIELFGYAFMEETPEVAITSVHGTANASIAGINIKKSIIQLIPANHEPFWVNRGDVIETARTQNYLEVRDEKLWTAQQGYLSDGILAFDIMYTSGGRSGYGIVESSGAEGGLVVCNYDANHDGKLTVEDDLNGDTNLDCTEFESLERTKLDGIEYWILAALPEPESRYRNAPTETFVAGRKIFMVPRNRYPKIINKKISINNFEL